MCTSRVKSLITVKVRNGVGGAESCTSRWIYRSKVQCFRSVISAPLKGQLAPREYTRLYDRRRLCKQPRVLFYSWKQVQVACRAYLYKCYCFRAIPFKLNLFLWHAIVYKYKFDDTYILSSFTEKSGRRENGLAIIDPIYNRKLYIV